MIEEMETDGGDYEAMMKEDTAVWSFDKHAL